jgi:DNA-binding response OmpR family regulator
MNAVRTVLVVEDNLQICEYLTEVLKGAEYNVVCVQNGEQAVEALDREHVDLAIIDLLLPGGNFGRRHSRARCREPRKSDHY